MLVWGLFTVTLPAWSAHLGHGVAGTWTVREVQCGTGDNPNCTALGDFVSTDLRLTRAHLSMDIDRSVMQTGRSFPAVDVGRDHLFEPGGGKAWIGSSLAAGLGVALLGLWIWWVPIRDGRRRGWSLSLTESRFA
ncbi:hypothetical protein [Kitasatospora sp. HPMI-4]|uniref:hypothetical protein n=1 Tax=Kitasatospora sp. HPMI-4 TaxID=3448443 RepID=UPI003F1D6D12